MSIVKIIELAKKDNCEIAKTVKVYDETKSAAMIGDIYHHLPELYSDMWTLGCTQKERPKKFMDKSIYLVVGVPGNESNVLKYNLLGCLQYVEEFGEPVWHPKDLLVVHELLSRLELAMKRTSKQKQTTDVVYRLNVDTSKLEELFEVTGFEENDASCKAIYEEIRDNYDFYTHEIYPVIRFENDTEYVGIVNVLIPLEICGKIYGLRMCRKEALEELSIICKALYERGSDFDARWEKLKEAIQEYHLFNDVCGFVADKIIEMNEDN